MDSSCPSPVAVPPWRESEARLTAEQWLERIHQARGAGMLPTDLQDLYLHAALRLHSDWHNEAYVRLHVEYGQVLGASGRVNDAEQQFEYCCKFAKQFAFVHITSAQFQLSRGNRDACRKLLLHAQSLGAEPIATITSALAALDNLSAAPVAAAAHNATADTVPSYSSSRVGAPVDLERPALRDMTNKGGNTSRSAGRMPLKDLPIVPAATSRMPSFSVSETHRSSTLGIGAQHIPAPDYESPPVATDVPSGTVTATAWSQATAATACSGKAAPMVAARNADQNQQLPSSAGPSLAGAGSLVASNVKQQPFGRIRQATDDVEDGAAYRMSTEPCNQRWSQPLALQQAEIGSSCKPHTIGGVPSATVHQAMEWASSAPIGSATGISPSYDGARSDQLSSDAEAMMDMQPLALPRPTRGCTSTPATVAFAAVVGSAARLGAVDHSHPLAVSSRCHSAITTANVSPEEGSGSFDTSSSSGWLRSSSMLAASARTPADQRQSTGSSHARWRPSTPAVQQAAAAATAAEHCETTQKCLTQPRQAGAGFDRSASHLPAFRSSLSSLSRRPEAASVGEPDSLSVLPSSVAAATATDHSRSRSLSRSRSGIEAGPGSVTHAVQWFHQPQRQQQVGSARRSLSADRLPSASEAASRGLDEAAASCASHDAEDRLVPKEKHCAPEYGSIGGSSVAADRSITIAAGMAAAGASLHTSSSSTLLPRRVPANVPQRVVLDSDDENEDRVQLTRSSSNRHAPSRHPLRSSVAVQTDTTNDDASLGGCERVIVKDKVYYVLSVLGRGGSSQVRRVFEPREKVVLALKTVNLSVSGHSSQQALDFFAREIHILERLQAYSNHVVKMIDFDHDRATKELHIVLECGDVDLATLLRSRLSEKLHSAPTNGSVSQTALCDNGGAFVRSLWVDMLQAVAVLHKEGIVHCDLKPANFVLVAGRVKLIDFGIANELEDDMSSIAVLQAAGTLNFMPPEMLDTGAKSNDGTQSKENTTHKVSIRGDIWSLGCILYYATYGRTPFQHITPIHQKIMAIVTEEHAIDYPPVNDPLLLETIKMCLIRNPRQRATIESLLQHPYATGCVSGASKPGDKTDQLSTRRHAS